MERQELRAELRKVLDSLLAKWGLQLQIHVVSSVCQPGDNYLGELLRVDVTAVSSRGPQELNLIFKCPPPNKEWGKLLHAHLFTRNEAAFYAQVLPKLESFRVEYSGEKLPPLKVPKFHTAVCDTDNNVLVFEDIKPNGFVMADKIKGLDIQHCKLVLQELARFHALSLAMSFMLPKEFTVLKELAKESMFFEGKRDLYKKIHIPCGAALKMVRERFPDTDYEARLATLTNDCFQNMMNLVSEGSFLSAINHGDCWTNNLMFHYNSEGQPDMLTMLDFQVIRYASLACDLVHFLYLCTTQQTRDQYWEEMINVYHIELNRALNKLTCNITVNRELLDKELRKFGAYGVGMAVLLIPLIVTTTDHQPSLDKGDESFDDLHEKSHNNEECFERLTDVVQDAVQRGFI